MIIKQENRKSDRKSPMATGKASQQNSSPTRASGNNEAASSTASNVEVGLFEKEAGELLCDELPLALVKMLQTKLGLTEANAARSVAARCEEPSTHALEGSSKPDLKSSPSIANGKARTLPPKEGGVKPITKAMPTR